MVVSSQDTLGLALKGRSVLVTGAASGIGRAVAQRFVEAQCNVAICDVNEPGLRDTAETLGADVMPLAFDIADDAACRQAIDAMEQRFGRVDVLVNAAALIVRQPLDEVSLDGMERMIRVNMAGPVFLARAAAGAMRRNGFGRIILFSSQGGHTGGYVGSTVYAMTKSAVMSLTKSLAREFAAAGITANAVAPGLVDTPMIRNDVTPKALEAFLDMVPLRRIAQPDELARCCLFLASDWSSYITGHVLDVNGGQVMR